MNEIEYRLPSGLTGIIRAWTTGELGVFGDRRIIRRPGPAIEAQLMSRAWVETLDHGIYAFTGQPPWLGEILQGDLLDACRQARILTWGDDMPVDFRCANSMCGEKIPWTVKLSSLPVRELSDEAALHFQNGNRIPWTFPKMKKQIVYSLPTGRTMVMADKLAKQHGRALHVIWAARIKQIEGVKSPSKYVDFLADLPPLEAAALEEELDRLDCGIDTTIPNVVCVECGEEHDYDVPFGPDFFLPNLGQRKKRRMTEELPEDDTTSSASNSISNGAETTSTI